MDIETLIEENEQIDDLGRGLLIIQKKQGFKYGTDSVLLAKFMLMSKNILPGLKQKRHFKCVDMGTGTGIIPLLLSRDERFTNISGLEIQNEYADMAVRSVELNGLSRSIKINHGDIKEAVEIYGKATIQTVVTNPPYKKEGAGIHSVLDGEAIARHEIFCTLEDVVRNSSLILEDRGSFFMINRPERLADAIEYMRKYKIEPKIIQFVQPKPQKKPSMFLVAGIKGGGKNLVIDQTLILMDEEGQETEALQKIYAY